MTEKQIINQAKKLFYNFEVIPEATAAEKEYNKNLFTLKGNPEEYPRFYNRVLVKRYQFYLSNWQYDEPITLYNISQVQTLIEIENAINEANDNCDWEKIDTLYIMQEEFLNTITPPEAYKKEA